MKVYLVLEPSYDWNDPLGVFSSMKKAREFVDELYLKHHPRAKKPPSWESQDQLSMWCIETYILDSKAGILDV